MKTTSKLLTILLSAAALTASSVETGAVNMSHYAENSKLAAGKWVKVSTDTEGVHEISYDQLAAMGFDDPAKVKIFGWGGNILSESLETITVDDLVQVPAICVAGKICFYAEGTMKRDVYYSSAADFLRYTTNTYSSHAYYFLTDDAAYAPLEPSAARQSASVSETLSTSHNSFHHERELTSPGSTGKSILGENFGVTNSLSFDVHLPGFVDGSPVNVYTNYGVNSDERSVLSATINGSAVAFSSNSNRVSASTSEYTFYNIGQARGTAATVSAPDGLLRYSMSLTTEGEITLALLDNFTINYKQRNELPADSAQLDMYYLNQSNSCIEIAGLSADAIVWNVTTAGSPKVYSTTAGGSTVSFNATLSASCEHLVAFDPTRTLRQISSYAPVENQNLHALATPDMVIVTSPGLKEQAQRIADYHATADGMDVAVIEQEKIFNEFSSGVPDATALRMFMKLLHLRNPEKLKYLLLFGGGTFDNRHLLGKKSEHLLITFQSTTSNVETKSYTCDDYFGMLADNTGYAIASAPVTIAVGRFPVKTVEEAKSSVDKLMRYLADDYGSWRNNVLIVGDQGDSDMHMYQAEGLIQILNGTDIKLNVNKLFSATYPQQGDYAIDFRKKWINMLQQGQVFMTYVGHGGSTVLGKETLLWVIQDSKNMENKHLPFMTFATCSAAPYDNDRRGVAEELFHNPQGGMIAGMVSTRTVFASENDELNRALVQNLFTLDENGEQRTIGEAYRLAKHAFDPNENTNKLSFALLGDPAMKLHMPTNQIEITNVGGTDVSGSTATLKPLQRVTVKGTVKNSGNTVNTGFNGNVTLTLYDKLRFHQTITMGGKNPRDSYFSREVLSTADCAVRNGVFEATIVVPKTCQAQNEAVKLMAMAVSADNSIIVNGQTENVTIAPFDAAAAITDTEAPVIESMYLDDEANAETAHVGTSAVLYVTATDDLAINAQTLAIGNALEVVLDGGIKSYAEARNIANVGNGGRTVSVALPIEGLSYGTHTLTFAVSDLAGNRASRSIDFVVDNTDNTAEVTADAKDARTSVTFAISHTLGSDAEATVTVTDAMHRTVWSTVTTADECEWNLTDMLGSRVAPGRYFYHCLVRNASGYAASQQQPIVVLAPAE